MPSESEPSDAAAGLEPPGPLRPGAAELPELGGLHAPADPGAGDELALPSWQRPAPSTRVPLHLRITQPVARTLPPLQPSSDGAPSGTSSSGVREFLSSQLGEQADGLLPSVREGERIGRFAVERQLGVGGMGEVFSARDDVLDRTVAIKVARGELDRVHLAKFVQEAQITGSLEHPGIVLSTSSGPIADGACISP